MDGITRDQYRHRWNNTLSPNIKKGNWTEEENAKLANLVFVHGMKKWARLAHAMDGRNGDQCRKHWNLTLNPNIKKGNWTEEEDVKLANHVSLHGEADWARLAQDMDGRNGDQCRHRWNNSLHPGIKKGSWTEEEDAKLVKLVSVYGNTDWARLAKDMSGRTGDQCRRR